MKKISIVGFGRFGKVLYRLLNDDFAITIYDINKRDEDIKITKHTTITEDLSNIYENDIVFFAVPIDSFEKVIAGHKKYFRDTHLLIDVLSVKMHPAKVFTKYLKGTKTQAILTHPMFGPDSSKDGFEGLPLIMDKFMSNKSNYEFWKNIFKKKKIRVIEMSASKHDKLAANSQGLTHFVGRLLKAFGLSPTPIDSLGAQKLIEIKEQVCGDTWQLFSNLQHYNPYTKKMRLKLGNKYEEVYNKLLPKRADPKCITYGIQGGKGSFNEEAMLYYLQRAGIDKYEIKYLYTSANVMRSLHEGKIDQGQFAIHNSLGGMVGESIEAMAPYKFKIADQFAIKISHALMIHPDTKLKNITRVMAHPQVFAQCKHNLAEKYPHLKLVSGKGRLIDHSVVAKNISQKKLPKNTATMGSKVLAKIYNLKIIEDNLQDAKENYTSFMHVTRN